MLLATKFLPLSLDANTIPRNRLLDVLGPAGSFRFLGIIAPAGFGKSTLARQWIDTHTIKFGWLTLDRNDNQPVNFWRYFIDCLRRAGLDTSSITEYFTAPADHEPTILASVILNLVNQYQSQVELVLDDFHHIQTTSLIDAITYLIDFAPANLTLLITSRNEPTFPFARWKVKRMARMVYSADLLFQEQEIQAFFQRSQQLDFSSQQTRQVIQTTGGWAAAIQLLSQETALQLSEEKETSTFDQTLKLTRKDIEDYVAYEVLEDLPKNLKNFILMLSPAYQFDASLANAILNSNTGHEFIAQLEARKLFLIRLDDQGEWFRFHDLLREGALHLLKESNPSSLKTSIHEIAKQYLKTNHCVEAINLICEFQEWDLLKSTLTEYGNNLLKQGYHLNIIDALQQAPANLAFESPKLKLVRLWCLFYNNQFTELADAVRQCHADPAMQNLSDDLQLELALLDSYHARFSKDLERARSTSLAVLEKLKTSNVPVKSLAYFGLANDYYSLGQYAEAEKALSNAITQGKLEQRFSTVKSSLGLLLWILQLKGEFIRGLNAYRETDQWIKNFHANDPDPNTVSCWLNSALILIHCERSQFEYAKSFLAPMLEFVDQAEPLQKMLVHYVKAEYHRYLGEFEEAIECYEKSRQILKTHHSELALYPLPLEIMPVIAFEQAQAKGHKLTGVSGISSLKNQPDNETSPFVRQKLLEASCLQQISVGNSMGSCFDRLITEAKTVGSLRGIATGNLLKAIWHIQAAQTAKAQEHLVQSAKLAETNDYIHMFAERWGSLNSFTPLLLKAGISQAFIDKVQQEYSDKQHGSASRVPIEPALASAQPEDHKGPPQSVDMEIEALSRRELQVLTLIHQGLANKEIAQQLHLAPTTVKAHIRNIYAKLGASSRTDALAKARNLGLLSRT